MSSIYLCSIYRMPEWDKELDAIETITIDIANSGLVDSFMDEEGNIVIPSDPASIVTSLLTNKAYQYTYHALSTISKSKLLSRSIPALIQYFIANGGETMSSYFPASLKLSMILIGGLNSALSMIAFTKCIVLMTESLPRF